MKQVIGAAFIAISAVSMAPNAAAQLIQNGGFEASPIVGPYQYTSTLQGWTVTGNQTVVFNSAYAPVGAGSQSVQIERAGDSLSQSFASVIGQAYKLDFLLSGYNNAPNAHLGVAVNGASLGNFTGTGLLYIPYTLFFTGTAATTTLSFANLGPTLGSPSGSSYPHLDNVSVTAVPEPSTYVLMLAGLGFVGFVARRRQRQSAA
jgi:hypothetical protein